MEPGKIVERIVAPSANGASAFESLRPMGFADHRGRARLSHYEGNVRLLFAVLTLAIRDWLAWSQQVDRGPARNSLERGALWQRLQEVNDWLFREEGAPGYSVELCAEIFRFDISAFRRALRGFLEDQRRTGVRAANLRVNLVRLMKEPDDDDQGDLKQHRGRPIRISVNANGLVKRRSVRP